MVVVRGDHRVNETKLTNTLGEKFRPAREDKIAGQGAMYSCARVPPIIPTSDSTRYQAQPGPVEDPFGGADVLLVADLQTLVVAVDGCTSPS